ncbi:MAG: phoB [Gammaproteobacteria bacterium]|jgi:two-component system phosphate regulon response regulator PhoB|nr:phoB [Gammaproteobacteria bacterium]
MTTSKKIHLLIVEDEAPIRDMIKFSLPAEFVVTEAENTAQAKTCIADRQPDIILLDWMLPGMSGVEFAKALRSATLTKNIPIILLTAKAEEENKIKGFDAGADDYITKPFSPRELIARIRSILKRGPIAYPDEVLVIGDIALNLQKHEVKIKNDILSLTPVNYRLLAFFMKHPNRTYSRDQLLQHVWENALEKTDRVVDVQIKRLRAVLSPYGCSEIIQTVRGSGYKMVQP